MVALVVVTVVDGQCGESSIAAVGKQVSLYETVSSEVLVVSR
jgi:hypothetical protein